MKDISRQYNRGKRRYQCPYCEAVFAVGRKYLATRHVIGGRDGDRIRPMCPVRRHEEEELRKRGEPVPPVKSVVLVRYID